MFPNPDNNISSSVPGPEVELGATFVADKTSPIVDRPVVSDGLDDPEAGNVGNKRGLLYRVNEWCPLHVGLVYGFQVGMRTCSVPSNLLLYQVKTWKSRPINHISWHFTGHPSNNMRHVQTANILYHLKV